MPGQGAETRAGHITQLHFDELPEVSVSDGGAVSPGKQAGIAPAFGKGEMYRSAPHRRSKAKKRTSRSPELTQATLDDLFSTQTLEADILPSLPIASIRAARAKKHTGQYTQLGFDTLPELFPIEGATALAPEPAENSSEPKNGVVKLPVEPPSVRADEHRPIKLENLQARVPGVRRKM